MSEASESVGDDFEAAGPPGMVNNLRGVLGALGASVDVAACATAVASVLLPVVAKAVAEAIKDPGVQAKLGEAGAMLFRPREG